MSNPDYHLVDVPGLGRILAPVTLSAQDVLRDLGNEEQNDRTADPSSDTAPDTGGFPTD
ncbi:hypothetical protein FIU86_17870 [Roseovarius sp. THAF9]|uniref:hypothetical protein n=1 Tax=Roseovarius sp. THAF9 TaxID=2587847 RepID=UPI0012A9C81F|nr:hypothetical protein [Roseovarius sp. THAF9]QFT94724.1 hypothetical protein FIU86_17870 [Roseovarius sp. THAF9]